MVPPAVVLAIDAYERIKRRLTANILRGRISNYPLFDAVKLALFRSCRLSTPPALSRVYFVTRAVVLRAADAMQRWHWPYGELAAFCHVWCCWPARCAFFFCLACVNFFLFARAAAANSPFDLRC